MEKTMQYAVSTTVTLLFCAFLSCTCDYTSGERATNQSGEYTAFTEGRGCGAVSSYESHVQIERAYRVFGHVAWTSRKGIFGATVNLDQLKLRWTDDRHLLVECRCKKETALFNDSHWQDITIGYQFSQ